MKRLLVALTTVGVLATCSHTASWLEFPLPPRAKTLGEKPTLLGDGAELELRLAPRYLDSVHDFYRETLGPPWNECPVNETRWIDHQGNGATTRLSSWRTDEKEFFSVVTRRPPTDAEDDSHSGGNVYLVYLEASVYSDLQNRIVCDSNGWELFSLHLVSDVWQFCSEERRLLEFSRSEWLAGDGTHRGRLAGDLLCRGLLLGLREDEVLSLLGPPDYMEKGESGERFGYRLRMVGGSRYRPPPPPDDYSCEEDWSFLEFQFDGLDSRETIAPFGVKPACRLLREAE